MVGWHHQCNGHELGQTPGDGDGQGSPACCSSWGHEKSDTTWQVNNEKQLLSTWIQPMSSYQSDVTERRVGKMLHSRISFELNIMKNQIAWYVQSVSCSLEEEEVRVDFHSGKGSLANTDRTQTFRMTKLGRGGRKTFQTSCSFAQLCPTL